MTILLASNSPRRRELIKLGGWDIETTSADIDETPRVNEPPRDYVLRLAESKARACLSKSTHGQIILGSDTTVVIDDEILGKPADADEAISMLKQLRGRTHQVLTAIAALNTVDGNLLTELCVTDVPMRNYSDEEIARYVASGDPLDKAGAYAIQHAEFKPVDSMAGCFASVMGLPLCHLTRLLNKMNAPAKPDIAINCQKFLEYNCPVFEMILKGEE